MKRGITGWAQVNGRNAISWEDKFKLDVWYIDNWSLLLDAKIKVVGFVKTNHLKVPLQLVQKSPTIILEKPFDLADVRRHIEDALNKVVS